MRHHEVHDGHKLTGIEQEMLCTCHSHSGGKDGWSCDPLVASIASIVSWRTALDLQFVISAGAPGMA